MQNQHERHRILIWVHAIAYWIACMNFLNFLLSQQKEHYEDLKLKVLNGVEDGLEV